MDSEAIGEQAAGGQIAGTSEAPAGVAGQPSNTCADCGTETIGPFCHNCGNASHVHRDLRHLAEELLHGVMHFDGRMWRTLPLLMFRPGRLTREWVQGRRKSYVSPLGIFLFTIFVIFMLVSYAPKPEERPLGRKAVAAAALVRWDAEVDDARQALADSPPTARAAAEAALREAEAAQAKARVRAANTSAAHELDDWKEAVAEQTRTGELQINTGNKDLDEKIRHKLENPDLALYKLEQTSYKFAFLLLPISVPLVALLFLWKRGVTLYDHAVFVLYSLTFMSLLALAAAGAARIGGAVATLAAIGIAFVAPIHMFAQLRGAYGLGVFSALWRTALLMILAAIALTLFLLAVVWLGMA